MSVYKLLLSQIVATDLAGELCFPFRFYFSLVHKVSINQFLFYFGHGSPLELFFNCYFCPVIAYLFASSLEMPLS